MAPAPASGSANPARLDGDDGRVLDQLHRLIRARAGGAPEASYTARLLARGRPRIAAKLLEEAGETAIAALAEPRPRLASESADLLYHLLVLWAEAGLEPQEVWQELAGRDAARDSGRGGDSSTPAPGERAGP